MGHEDWDQHYASGHMPWDSDEPDERLVELVRSGTVQVGTAIDIGCGTGTHALWLAQQGFEVLGVDISPLAIERARGKASAVQGVTCRFETLDFLEDEPLAGSFQLAFDRGCLHVFDERAERGRFAARVAGLLAPGGLWLSLLGSTEGPAREMGPPRRSVRDIAEAIEPSLEIVRLDAIEFALAPELGPPPKAWRCIARRRDVPAQPSKGVTSS